MTMQAVLKKYLLKKKKAHTGFSIRSLARDLQVSPSFLSRIFNSQKAVPYGLLLKLKKPLGIEDEVFQTILDRYSGPISTPLQPTEQSPLENWDFAENSSFSVLRQWFYLPILECTTLKGYDGSFKKIAKKLGLSETVVEIAVREMAALGLMIEKNGHFTKSKSMLRWSTSTSKSEVRNFHHQMMTKAQELLRFSNTEEDYSKRLITGITLTVSPNKINRAKKLLSDALHNIANELGQDKGSEVYQLSGQLIPLTK
jgi:transcriptional regulator with XRE-family HTH domain